MNLSLRSNILQRPLERSSHFLKIALLASAATWTGMAVSAVAQDVDTQEKATEVEEITITGSRRKARSAADTPAPVDVITADDFKNQGSDDMTDLLRNLVPSLNVNTQPINDGTTLIRPANLRGLPPDNTLILVNGKRRHRAAVITFLGGGLSDGAQGPDISAIPSIALKQVEVLRDGAAAQYGSDAIAGVINFILSDRDEGGTITAKYGSTYEGDGSAYQFSGIYGMPIGEGGYINFSGEYRHADPTSRSVQRNDAAALIAGGNTDVANPAQIWGQPEIKSDIKLFVNMLVDMADNQEFYAFGNYSEREAEGGFFFRNPNTRGGVFSNDGGVTRLVGDTTPNDNNICRGAINFATGKIDNPLLVGDTAGYAAVAGDENCFLFNEMFPGGFTPRFGGDLNDIAGAMGIRGETDGGLVYDVSVHAGRNQVDYKIKNTVNASLAGATPNEFKLGSYVQLEKNVNIALSYPIEVDGFFSPLNVAGGFEWREEQFSVHVGQKESFQQGVLSQIFYPTINTTNLIDHDDNPATPDQDDGVDETLLPHTQGFGIGSNGFAGFSPDVAGVYDRKNIAFYLDLEADVTENLVLGIAVRYEDFSDFGGTFNYKFSGLYRVSDEISFRGTYATGFRAPTPGQSNVNNISTVLENGVLTQRGTIPPTNLVAASVGGKPLTPEKSKSFSLGAAYVGDNISITLDYFNIKMDDRITQSSSFTLTTAQKFALEAQGITGGSDLGAFRFFVNDFGTRTQGLDLVVTIPLEITDEGTSNLSFAGNYTKTKVDAGPNLIGDKAKCYEECLPSFRGNMTFTHQEEKWRALARVHYHSGYYEPHLDDATLPIFPGAEVMLDIEFSYNVMEEVELTLGATNLFNNYPDLNPYGESIVGAKYPTTAPLGFNGGFWYAKVKYNF